MEVYLKSIDSVEGDDDRRSNKALKTTPSEMESYHSLAGELVSLRGGTMPQAAVIGSFMQQKIPVLTVRNLLDSKRVVQELKDMLPFINVL